jgi:putative transposase
VLVGPVAKDCNKAIQERCSEAGWQILALDIQPNYVHLYVRAWPTNSAYEVTKQCKMRTSHDLCKKYKQLMSMASLWTRSYFASTEAVVTSEMIAEFVEAQRGI